MKVTPEHRIALRALIAPLDTEAVRARYIARDFPRAELVNDLDTRYRWDLFHAARGYEAVRDGDYTTAHLDTALRAIVKPLES